MRPCWPMAEAVVQPRFQYEDIQARRSSTFGPVTIQGPNAILARSTQGVTTMTHLSRTLAIALLAGAGVASMASALKPAPTATPTPALVAPALEFVTEEFPPLNFNNKDGQ